MSRYPKSPLFVIPARGGSKGIPRKNLAKVGGISLVGRAVRTALDAAISLGGGRVLVDSDSGEILEEGRRWGAETPFVRPAELAGDSASTMSVLQHLLLRLGDEGTRRALVLLQATSPFTTAAHVVDAVRRHDETGAPVVSLHQGRHPLEWSMRVVEGKLEPALPGHEAERRQDLAPHYEVSGAAYVMAASDVRDGKPFIQPGVTEPVFATDHPVLDIDTPEDMAVAQALGRGFPVLPVAIGSQNLGNGTGCFILARVEGPLASLRLALHSVERAASLGADGLRFALGDAATPWAHELKRSAETLGLTLVLDVCPGSTARLVDALRPDAIALDLKRAPIECLADVPRGHRLPALLASEDLDLPTLDHACRRLRNLGSDRVVPVLNLAPDDHPHEAFGLGDLREIRDALRMPIGVSDQSPSPAAALASVGCGVALWEGRLDEGGDAFIARVALVREAARRLART